VVSGRAAGHRWAGPGGCHRHHRSLKSRADQQATSLLTAVAIAALAAAIAALAAAIADLTLPANLAGHALATSGALQWAPVVVAVVASLTRGTLATQAARRCLGARAART
jgi:hypothetical protein